MDVKFHNSKLRIQLISQWWRLVPGIKEQKFVEDVQNTLSVKHKNTITRRTTYSAAEKKAVEKIFTKYGVTANIWQTLN